jgi:hypothetical protein
MTVAGPDVTAGQSNTNYCQTMPWNTITTPASTLSYGYYPPIERRLSLDQTTVDDLYHATKRMKKKKKFLKNLLWRDLITLKEFTSILLGKAFNKIKLK